jgi:hypothetical protein
MAIKEEFEIRISKNGEVKIIAKGFSGTECEVPLKTLQKATDEEGQSRIEHTEEFYDVKSSVEAKVKDK